MKIVRWLTESRLSAFDAFSIVIVATLADNANHWLLGLGVVLIGSALTGLVGSVLKHIAK